VPSFRTSLAGQALTHHLRQLGYYIYETLLDPHNEWDEPQDRRRWLIVATLQPGFCLKAPMVPFAGDLSTFIDPPSAQDRPDAERIAGSIVALVRHRERHRALGHGLVSPPSLKRHLGCLRLCVPITKLMLGRSLTRFLVLVCSASTKLSASWVAPLTANTTQRQLRFLGKVSKRGFSEVCLPSSLLSCETAHRSDWKGGIRNGIQSTRLSQGTMQRVKFGLCAKIEEAVKLIFRRADAGDVHFVARREERGHNAEPRGLNLDKAFTTVRFE
jgi:hypothetical protein